MININKIFLMETPQEVLLLTQTSNFSDAERVAIETYEKSMRTGKMLIRRIICSVIGAFLMYISLWFFPLFLLGIFFILIAIFSPTFGQRALKKKFAELRALLKSIDGYPELVIMNNIATFFPGSALGSQSAKINDAGALFLNTDSTKHLWNQAGFCRVAIKRDSRGKTEWQNYYMFAYQFHGSVPQTVLIHARDPFHLPASPDNKILTDLCPPWQCITSEQYEIETLAVLSQDIISKLRDLAENEPPCTLEFFESKLFCFIPVDTPKISELLSLEKTADNFAHILLPKLKGSNLTIIGDILPILALDIESNEENVQSIGLEKVGWRWVLACSVILVLIIYIGHFAISSGMSPLAFLIPTVIAFFVSIVLAMPKRFRAEWLRGSGLRINGRKVSVRREKIKNASKGF